MWAMHIESYRKVNSLSYYYVKYCPLQEGWAPLHSAALNGNLHIVRELTEKMNADVLAQKPV